MKKYFLVYDDETKWFTHQKTNLLNSVKKFSDFEVISFKKSEIDKDFLEKKTYISN